ncbi:exosome complex component rrp45 [Anoplophora glabripennis]|uniref:exosome complex component rrp45 n=1 Tax=Anoplophora glabripennis TaxID=217634 RepID=UPI0008739AE8|nr:exosome complex component rrp45 [Anoplophora glabripennis]
MSNIRKTIISNCEKSFLNKNLCESLRLDGRSFDEFRETEIEFGKDWGCCYVSLGKTRVLAQVSCEIHEPKTSRPSEGILNINIELNPIAAPHFEAGRQCDLSIQLNRLLEKCLKDSKAVDLESLCIKMNEKVWMLKVDINVLNHEGNILDCASIAALSALTHFRRPDVTCDGEEFIIHNYKQRDPIPIVIHHYPICVTYSIFNGGTIIVADPNLLEEGAADGFLSVGLNTYKELCGLHLGGKVDLSIDVILDATNKAAARADFLVHLIKDAVEKDNILRQEKCESGFYKSVKNVKEQCVDVESIYMEPRKFKDKLLKKKKTKNVKETALECHDEIKSVGKRSAVLIPNVIEDNFETWQESDSEDDIEIVETIKPVVDITIDNSESEEDVVLVLNADNKTCNKKKLRS